MISNYSNFILESKYQDLEKEYHSIGEYIEKVSKDNDYLIGIISNYIKESDTDIRISNAVNLLTDFDKKQLFYRVYNYLNKGEEEKDVDIMTNVVFESLDVKAGKNIFNSFLKAITALGLKNIPKSDNPSDFLFFYKTMEVDINKVKSIFYRFKSLGMFMELVDYTNNSCGLYYGIKSNSMFEYGFYTDKIIPMGEFKLNKGSLNWLLMLQSQSALPLKKDIVSLNINNISLFGKICNEITNFNLNAQSKNGPIVNGDVITFGYYGIGKWDGGVLEDTSYQHLKSEFKNWLSKYKWSKSLLVNISYNSYWVYFNIKLK